MAMILKGAPVVAAMNEANAARCEALKAKGITPTLAVVRVGAREDDLSYERGVTARCGKVGVAVRQYLLPADAAQEQARQAKAKARKADIKGIVALLVSILSFLLQIIIHHAELVDFVKKLAEG